MLVGPIGVWRRVRREAALSGRGEFPLPGRTDRVSCASAAGGRGSARRLTAGVAVLTLRGLMATSVRAHITGTVWKIEVAVGEAVSEGQTLVILESMKMEMPVESPAAGKVTSIAVAEGASVEEGAVLLDLG